MAGFEKQFEMLLRWTTVLLPLVVCKTDEVMVADLFKMLAGIGVFVVGMGFLEESLRRLAGRTFKLFLRQHTSSKIKAIGGGALVTAALQSSSVVNLMVLAFVGAGVITMKNALAVILGANIGTTLTGWMVATLGFEISMEALAWPLVGIGGIALAALRMGSKAFYWMRFVFGFGLLFIGLEFMKTSFLALAHTFDFSALSNYPAVVFVLVGVVLTSVIQSSSATVAIVLAALYANSLSLLAAMAVVLGSEVGTTIKLLLAAMGGVPAKKRVAFGNFFYNSVVIMLVLIFLQPIHTLLTDAMGLRNPLTALVFFQTFINVAGVLFFLPFLNVFERWLSKRFSEDDGGAHFLSLVPPSAGDLAVETLEKEADRYLWYTLDFLLHSFHLHDDFHPPAVDQAFHRKHHGDKYEQLKRVHGEMHAYFLAINKSALTADESEQAERLMSSIRNALFACKSIHDSLGDIDQFRNSSNEAKYRYYQYVKDSMHRFCREVEDIMQVGGESSRFERLVNLFQQVRGRYPEELRKMYDPATREAVTEVEVSTLINFNRELFSAYKAFVWALKDFYLNQEQGKFFAELPGFIR